MVAILNDFGALGGTGQNEDDLRADRLGGQLVALISDTIEGEIVSGRLPPDADLNSVELARRFGTSRTPIREALLHLSREGLVDLETGKRPRVSAIKPADLQELFEVRTALLKLAVQLVVRSRSPETLTALERLSEKIRLAAGNGDNQGITEALLHVLDLLSAACGNSLLALLLDSLRARTRRMLHFASARIQFHDELAADGLRLVAALKDGDANLAAALMESTTARTFRWFADHPHSLAEGPAN